jgi:hypothetical protein
VDVGIARVSVLVLAVLDRVSSSWVVAVAHFSLSFAVSTRNVWTELAACRLFEADAEHISNRRKLEVMAEALYPQKEKLL